MTDYSIFNQLNSARRLNGADKQMLFQERLANTAHQREVEDLKAAGLNPVLSAGGSGAAVPSGSDNGSSVDNPLGQVLDTFNHVMNTNAKTMSQAVNSMSKSLKEVNKMIVNNANRSGDIPRRTVSDAQAEEDAKIFLKLLSSPDFTSYHASKVKTNNYGLKPDQIKRVMKDYYANNVDYSFLDKKTGPGVTNPLDLQNIFATSSFSALPLAISNPATAIPAIMMAARNFVTHPNIVKGFRMNQMAQGRNIVFSKSDIAKATKDGSLMGVAVTPQKSGPSKKSTSSKTSSRSGSSYKRNAGSVKRSVK